MRTKILDCTLRDGGYMNNWYFDKKMARESYRALSKAGVDVVEIGFRGSDKYFDKEKYGLWRFSEDSIISEITSGINGAKIAVMGDYGKIEVDDFAPFDDSPVDIVRIAVHKNNLKPCVLMLEKIKEKGYEVSLNAMGYTSYSNQERTDLAKLLNDSNLDYLYLADSYGSILPEQIPLLYEPLFEIQDIKLGFHPHNNLQMAFANTLEAIKLGVDIIDCTLYGMGRAAGNLPTEVMINYLQLTSDSKYNVIPILNCVDTFLLPMREKYEWGYQVAYMLSGMYKCHPNYAGNLLKMKRYNVEDICIAMEEINKVNPVGYSQEVLDKIIHKGIIGRAETNSTKVINDKENTVPYIHRHKGKDFLILANGPSLIENKVKIDKFIEKYDPIILGANNLSGLFKPHYHAFNNKRRYTMYVDNVSTDSNLLLSQYFNDAFIKEYTQSNYEKLFYLDNMDADFSIIDGVIQTNCRTISILLLGIAIVMGANRLFVAGMDGYLNMESDKTHFYNEIAAQTDEDILLDLHRYSQKYLAQIDAYHLKNGKEGVHILTPTSYKSFYKGIDNYL